VGAFLNLPKERYACDKHKDRDSLLTLYDFPAEHWNHLRAEPDRERVRHSAAPQRSPQGCVIVGFRLAHGVQAGHGSGLDVVSAQGRKPVIQGVTFRNGVELTNMPAQNTA